MVDNRHVEGLSEEALKIIDSVEKGLGRPRQPKNKKISKQKRKNGVARKINKLLPYLGVVNTLKLDSNLDFDQEANQYYRNMVFNS